MKNFIFKSQKDFDLQKIVSINKLDILMKNVLYVTHECDKILKIVKSLETSQNLQRQVDEYFEETSPQTDNEDKEPD